LRVLFNIGHPAHVHLFKNVIWALEKEGYDIKITARDKEIVLHLLDAYGFEYDVISKKGSGLLGLTKEMIIRDYNLLKIARGFRPDIMVAVLDHAVAHIGKLLGIPSIIFNDSEPEAIKYPIADIITTPFASTIIVPRSLKHSYGDKEIRINSYKELAYLHPNHFKPDFKVIRNAGISKNEKFVLVRFVAWEAHHDISEGGFSLKHKLQLVKELKEYASVYISSEFPLPKELKKYRLPIPPDYIHHFLYYSNLLVCDSQTMTTEAGILGTPAIRSNSFVGKNDMSNFIELEKRYGLIYNIPHPEKAIKKAIELIQQPKTKKIWKKKRESLLREKIDLTSFMVWFIENYPESFSEIKENPGIQYRVR